MVRGRGRPPGDATTSRRPGRRSRRCSSEHVPDAAERRWIEPALLVAPRASSRASARSSCSAPGGRSSSGSRRPARWSWSSRTSTTPTPGLLDFIDHLLEWSRSVPIYIVTLARPELLERRPDWGAGKRSFTSIHLEPLPDRGDARAARRPRARACRTAARDAIVARADGIPLYAVETVRMLLAEGRLVARGRRLPAGRRPDRPRRARDADRAHRRPPRRARRGRPGARRRRRGPRPELHAGRRSRPSPASTPATLEPRLRALVRRELLVQQVDPRSPERGQYAFVQALIREVAYNTLAKRDRKVRHLAAARFFESLGTDELAGALAGHYLAAHGYAADGPEADALAAQARIALRGAAERAAALGSHEQAIAFLEQALAVSPDAGRSGRPPRAGAGVGDAGPRRPRSPSATRSGPSRPGASSAIARRSPWRRRRTPRRSRSSGPDGDRVLEIVLPAWEEFSDLEETPAGVALMLAARDRLRPPARTRSALDWLERLLPVAERLDLLAETGRRAARG